MEGGGGSDDHKHALIIISRMSLVLIWKSKLERERFGKVRRSDGSRVRRKPSQPRVKVWSKERGQRAGMYGHRLGNVTERVRK